MPTRRDQRDVDDALDLAERIVMRQGNIFIRELLRRKRQDDKSIRIGDTETKIKENLDAAIRARAISLSDLEEWLDEVEGWGNQHIYLYDVTEKLADDSIFRSRESVRRRVLASGHGDLWETAARPTSPDELTLPLTLVRITFDGDQFVATWDRWQELWKHDESEVKSFQRKIGVDTYEFRPYRQLLKRSVMRFVLRREARLAGLFIQLPLGDEHDAARERAMGLLMKLLACRQEGDLIRSLRPVRIHDVIVDIDSRYIDGRVAGVRGEHAAAQTKTTKFDSHGATIEFDSGPHMGTRDVGPVRRVRLALSEEIRQDPGSFRGESGTFRVPLLSGTGSNRTITMYLNGQHNRIYFRAQMTSDEVWTVLAKLRERPN